MTYFSVATGIYAGGPGSRKAVVGRERPETASDIVIVTSKTDQDVIVGVVVRAPPVNAINIWSLFASRENSPVAPAGCISSSKALMHIQSPLEALGFLTSDIPVRVELLATLRPLSLHVRLATGAVFERLFGLALVYMKWLEHTLVSTSCHYQCNLQLCQVAMSNRSPPPAFWSS